MHLHTLTLDVDNGGKVECEGCPIDLRLATYEEAVHVKATGDFHADGPMVFKHNKIVVPRGYSV